MLCDNLTLEGYHAEHVLTGPRAIERMARGGIDLLILDIMLPGCDGFEVLRQLRERGDHTPVLVLSARSADEDRIRGLELAADDYLTKPFNLRELLLRVEALLRRQPAPTPGSDSGNVTCQNACRGEAPRSAAASSSAGSCFASVA
jgi:two-component system alkaline phosphatase synthesis response regulator PhoP